MCGGKPKIDTSYQKQMQADAVRARAEEEARKARIKDGNTKIDTQFKQFDDSFFGGFEKNYLDFYKPDIENKFSDAKDQLTFGLARAGTLNSSMAGDRQGRLLSDYNMQTAANLSQAQDATATLRGNVNQEKSSLISLLNATGDSEMAGNQALSRSAQLFKAQPTYNPLGDIFGGAANGIGNYYAGKNDRAASDAYFNPGKSASKAGSSKVIY